MAIQTPIDPSGTQGLFNGLGVAPFLGSYTIANLPTTMPSSVQGFTTGGPIPIGSMALVTNAAAAPVRGAAPSATGAVVAIAFWAGGAWSW